MILEAGFWAGRGSFRPTTESTATAFRARLQVATDVAAGLLIDATLHVDGGDERSAMAWIAPDEVGTYGVTVRGLGVDVEGTAKLESEPHLGLLWSEDGRTHVAFALFALREAHALRGFAKSGDVTWTWELALRPVQPPPKRRPGAPDPAKAAGEGAANVVSLADRRRQRR